MNPRLSALPHPKNTNGTFRKGMRRCMKTANRKL